jgi:hypothetical protein
LIATGFLVGFVAQLKKMFDETRLISSVVFLGSMAATLGIFSFDRGSRL